MQENTDIKNIHDHIKILEKRYKNNLGSHLFFPLADAYSKADMLDQAEIILREGLSGHPKYCAARALLGEILFKKGNLQDAQQQLEEVIEMVPDNIMAHKLLLEVYKKNESKDKYEKELEILQVIDHKEISYSDTGQIKSEIAETFIKTNLHRNETVNLKAKDQIEVTNDKKSQDFIEESIIETTTSEETNQGKKSSVADTQQHQSRSFQQSGEEATPISNEAKFQEEGKNEIVTATLAELYFTQGFLDRSIEIYKKLLMQQPGQEKWAKRLIEIQEINNKIETSSELTSEGIQHPETENKKEKILAELEKWLKNCQNLKKSKM